MQSNLPKIFNVKKLPPNETGVNVMRPSKWGNPFIIGLDGNRDDVCDKFEVYVKIRPKLIADAKKELKGQNLICCCGAKRCHAQTWFRIANEEELTF